MRLMFVELGSSSDVWRAHIARGILAAHGIDAVLWHENAVHIYGPGWGAHCIVLVDEDDAGDAVEVLQARPEATPSGDDLPDTVTPGDFFPGLWASILGAGILWVIAAVIELAIHFLMHLNNRPFPQDEAPFRFPLLGAPFFALFAGFLMYITMLPLRAIKGGSWMALVAYFWVKVVLLILAVGIALMLGP